MTASHAHVVEYARRCAELAVELVAALRRWKWVWITGVAALVAVNHWFTFGINASSSLPEAAYLVFKQDHALRRGDYVSFRWHGGGPYQPGLSFVKIVMGVPGDVVTLKGRDVYINGRYVSTAKTHASTGQALALGPTGVIPDGHYYVHAPSTDSLDSRYAITGWIKADAVIGKAEPVL